MKFPKIASFEVMEKLTCSCLGWRFLSVDAKLMYHDVFDHVRSIIVN